MSFEDTIDFIQDGEDVTAAVLNRPVSQFASRLDLLEKIDRDSTLGLSFDKQTFKVYGDGQTRLPFEDVLDFTRNSKATYFDPIGKLRTADIDQPRFTYDPETGKADGFLIEEQRTNILLWSEDFTQPVWSKVNDTSAIATTNASPIDSVNWQRIESTVTGSGSVILQQTVTHTDAISISLFVKPDELGYLMVRFVGVKELRVTVDLSTGLIADSLNFSGEFVGTVLQDGAVLIKLSDSGLGVATSNIEFWGKTSGDTSTGTYNLNTGDGLELIGTQVEEGSSPTSYIKTEDTQGIRNADNCSRALGSEFNRNEGTLFWEGICGNTENSFQVVLGVSDGTNDNRTLIRLDPVDSRIRAISVRSGVVSSAVSPVIPLFGVDTKIALTYDTSGWQIWANGVLQIDQSDVTGDVIANTLHLNNAPGSDQYTGLSSVAKYYPRALSATELKTLTS